MKCKVRYTLFEVFEDHHRRCDKIRENLHFVSMNCDDEHHHQNRKKKGPKHAKGSKMKPSPVYTITAGCLVILDKINYVYY
jgi:hypothetical protein